MRALFFPLLLLPAFTSCGDTKEFARLVEEGDKTIEVVVEDWYK